jgi:hypothetical protein
VTQGVLLIVQKILMILDVAVVNHLEINLQTVQTIQVIQDAVADLAVLVAQDLAAAEDLAAEDLKSH